jgi:hypothetical protein
LIFPLKRKQVLCPKFAQKDSDDPTIASNAARRPQQGFAWLLDKLNSALSLDIATDDIKTIDAQKLKKESEGDGGRCFKLAARGR